MRELLAARRVIELTIAGEARLVAVERRGALSRCARHAAAAGLPQALLEPSADALGDLIKRYARTHGPFTARDIAHAIRPADCGHRSGARAT